MHSVMDRYFGLAKLYIQQLFVNPEKYHAELQHRYELPSFKYSHMRQYRYRYYAGFDIATDLHLHSSVSD